MIVEIYSWREGFRKVSFTKLLMNNCGLNLSNAKEKVDLILENTQVDITFKSLEIANSFIEEANDLGVNSRLKD